MIIFNKETHTYRLDGQPIPSVTQILKEASLVDLSHINAGMLNRASKFGDAVHLACHLYNINDLNDSTLDPKLRPYLDAWIKFLKDLHITITDSEKPIASRKFWVAGTPDDIGCNEIKNLIEIKTGEMLPVVAIQTGAYEGIYNEGKPRADKIRNRIVVQLCDDGNYKLAPDKWFSRSDWSAFLACLTVMNIKRKWGIKNGKYNRS